MELVWNFVTPLTLFTGELTRRTRSKPCGFVNGLKWAHPDLSASSWALRLRVHNLRAAAHSTRHKWLEEHKLYWWQLRWYSRGGTWTVKNSGYKRDRLYQTAMASRAVCRGHVGWTFCQWCRRGWLFQIRLADFPEGPFTVIRSRTSSRPGL